MEADTDSTSPKPADHRTSIASLSLLYGLLVVEGFLFLSDQFQWCTFNTHKGRAVLIAVECVAVAILLMLIRCTVQLLLRRPFRFSRHSFLILVIAVCLPGAWLAAQMVMANAQYQAAERLRAIKPSPGNHVGPGGGIYRYEMKDVEIPVLEGLLTERQIVGGAPRQARALLWLKETLGQSFFLDVALVQLDFTEVTDADLAQTEKLKHLQWLNLGNTNITDAGLEHLRGLTHLRGLWLDGTQVTDDGLGNLSRMGSLEALSLQSTRVTGTGLKYIQGARNLQVLHFDVSQVGDAGMEYLKPLTQLKELYLRNTRVTDNGLNCVRGLSQLTILSLEGVQITDGGLQHLRGLTQLKELFLQRTHVTDEGVARLQRALPGCKIGH